MVAKNKKIKKGSKQNIFFSVLLGVLIFVVVGSLIVANWRNNQRRAEYNAQIKILQEELQALEFKRLQLEAQISQTAGDDYLERQARERFNLKKSGEEVVVVLPAEGEENQKQEKSFWEKILDKIKFW